MPKVRSKNRYYNPRFASDEVEVNLGKCEYEDCEEMGGYKAPSKKGGYGNYCQKHAREINEKWDYFKNMSEEEIIAYQKDAMHGHRPTWKAEQKLTSEVLFAALHNFLQDDVVVKKKPSIAVKYQKALKILELEYPATKKEIQKQYRLLVKKTHPDATASKESVNQFRKIKEAYEVLKNSELFS